MEFVAVLLVFAIVLGSWVIMALGIIWLVLRLGQAVLAATSDLYDDWRRR